MISYSLKCAGGHVFDAWFRDSAAYEALAASHRLACAVCGDPRVEKAMMAPALAGQERPAPPAKERAPQAATPAAPVDAPAPMLSGPPGPVEKALAQLRRYLGEKADYVGRGFADEARRIHLGEADERAIWGEATREEARALSEEGVPVAPLPFLSRRDD
jgi:hypothetical protein